MACLFLLLMTAASWRLPHCCDFGLHAAVVERLRADPLDPAHPVVGVPGAGSPYYSPYTLAQGLMSVLSGLPGRYVVLAFVPLNLLVLLTGVRRFTRLFSARPWAPVAALGAIVLLWGTQGIWWSGFLGLTSLAVNLSYPSAFAIGLTLHVWASAGHVARAQASLPAYARLGLLCALVVLTHPITGVATLAGVACLAAGWQRGRPARIAGRWALTGALLIAAAVSWPYFDVLSLVRDARVDHVHDALYEDLLARSWIGLLLGVPALWLRWRRDRRDPLVLMFAVLCVIVLYGRLSGHSAYGRVTGLALIPAQVALAVELVRPGRARRALAPFAAAGACLALLTVHAGAVVPRAVDPVGFVQPPRWPSYDWAARHLAPGDVVLTNDYRAMRVLPAYGVFLVAPAWPDPALPEPERQRRWNTVSAYLAPGSTAAYRRTVVRGHRVRWVLVNPSQRLPAELTVVAVGPVTGEVLARVSGATRREQPRTAPGDRAVGHPPR
ncbi:hypothetical protein [Streptomyces sp. GC420]|uniref:hypothetical protein n=1 Tax=Streptomyces sp. GC420 TaxID=2697568 RepID=UPI001AA0BDFF|nr:hypothetical protein [Streptomyces sp. GC420]